MSIFLDVPFIIKLLEELKKKYLFGIFKINRLANYHLLMLILCDPPIEYLLLPRLVEIIKKYVSHFNSKPKIFDELIESFSKRLGDIEGMEKDKLKEISYNKGVSNLGKYLKVNVSDNFLKLRKEYFSTPNIKDSILLKFLLKTGIFSRYFNKKCLLCGKVNEANHLFVSCNNTELCKWKENYINKLLDCLNEEDINDEEKINIYSIIVYIFFNPKNAKREFKKNMKLIKEVVFELYKLLAAKRRKKKEI